MNHKKRFQKNRKVEISNYNAQKCEINYVFVKQFLDCSSQIKIEINFKYRRSYAFEYTFAYVQNNNIFCKQCAPYPP